MVPEEFSPLNLEICLKDTVDWNSGRLVSTPSVVHGGILGASQNDYSIKDSLNICGVIHFTH
jgi:hypothetical protein